MWGVFSFYMWLGTFRANRAVQLTFLGAWITFMVLGVSHSTAIGLLHKLGGYARLGDGGARLRSVRGRGHQRDPGKTVLPIGPYRDILSEPLGVQDRGGRCPVMPRSLPASSRVLTSTQEFADGLHGTFVGKPLDSLGLLWIMLIGAGLLI